MRGNQTSHIRRVILFGIDGGGTFFEQANTPCIDRVFGNGAISRRTLTERPTVSAECWGSMLHGVHCEQHRLTNWIASHVPFPVDSPYPSVFRAIRAARPQAKLASFCDWEAINTGIIEDNLGVYKYSACDYALIEPAIRYITENPDFTMIFFQFDSVDHNGHQYGYGSPDYLAAITANDCYIAKIVEALEEQNLLEDTLLMVEADHGGTPGSDGHGGGHGGDTDAEKYVFFAAAGNGVLHAELYDMIVRDTSPAILHALGIPQPDSWTGRVPCGMFEDLPGVYPRPHEDEAIQSPRLRIPERGDFETTFSAFSPLLYSAMETADAARTTGKLYSVPGRAGSAIRFDDGSLAFDCPSLSEGFTLCCWVRAESVSASGVLAANRSVNWSDAEPGFTLELGGDYLTLKIRAMGREKPIHCEFSRPRSAVGDWWYLACVVDALGGEIRFSVNFAPLVCWKMPNGRFLPDGGTLRLGGDGVQSGLPAEIDSLLICRRQLSNDDLASLQHYYRH